MRHFTSENKFSYKIITSLHLITCFHVKGKHENYSLLIPIIYVLIIYFITSLESDLLRGEIAFTCEAKPSVEKAIKTRNSTFEMSIEHYFSLRHRKACQQHEFFCLFNLIKKIEK
jgi:hypothetical protein